MRKQVTVRRYACAVCGRRDLADRMIYSRHTGNRFCSDFGACRKRLRRKGGRRG